MTPSTSDHAGSSWSVATTLRPPFALSIRTVEHFAALPSCSRPVRAGADSSVSGSYVPHLEARSGYTITQRLAALRFLYIQVLKRGWSVAETPYPKKVLHLPGDYQPAGSSTCLIDATETSLPAPAGLDALCHGNTRRAEVARLTVSDIDSQRMVVHIRGVQGAARIET